MGNPFSRSDTNIEGECNGEDQPDRVPRTNTYLYQIKQHNDVKEFNEDTSAENECDGEDVIRPEAEKFINPDVSGNSSKCKSKDNTEISGSISTGKGTCNDRLWCGVLLYANITAAILICILIGVIVRESEPPVPRTEFCVKASLIGRHPYDGTDSRRCNSTHCCFPEITSTGSSIKHMASRWLKEKMAQDENRLFDRFHCGNESKQINAVSISMETVKLVRRRKRSTEHPENVLWDLPSGNETDKFYVFHENEGIIEIKQPALYYIYSQVNAEYDMTNVTRNLFDDFYHIIVSRPNLNDKKDEKTLFRNSNSICKCDNTNQFYSSYLAGNAYLLRGDKVAVRVYDKLEYEMRRPEANFLGLQKLR